MNPTVDVFVSNLPIGAIIMYYGHSIPNGWAVCDGTNGTPDLIGRFPMGVSSFYDQGKIGGQDTVTLTVDQLPPHTHAYQSYSSTWNLFTAKDPEQQSWAIQSVNGTSGSTGSGSAIPITPLFCKVFFIMRVS